MSRSKIVSALLATAFGADAVAALSAEEEAPAVTGAAATNGGGQQEEPADPPAEEPEAEPAPTPAPAPAPAAARPAAPAAGTVQSADAVAAIQEARELGAREERARTKAVLSSPEGKANPGTAAFLLCNSTTDADGIIAALKEGAATGTIHSTRSLDLSGGKPAGSAEEPDDKGPKALDVWGEAQGVDYTKAPALAQGGIPGFAAVAPPRVPVNTAN